MLKFIYSEKATKFCEISTIDLTVTTWDKSTVEISQKFVAFSEYMNFTSQKRFLLNSDILYEFVARKHKEKIIYLVIRKSKLI